MLNFLRRYNLGIRFLFGFASGRRRRSRSLFGSCGRLRRLRCGRRCACRRRQPYAHNFFCHSVHACSEFFSFYFRTVFIVNLISINAASIKSVAFRHSLSRSQRCVRNFLCCIGSVACSFGYNFNCFAFIFICSDNFNVYSSAACRANNLNRIICCIFKFEIKAVPCNR